MHARVVYLGWEKVSCLERCPQFRSVLIEREVETHFKSELVCYSLFVVYSQDKKHGFVNICPTTDFTDPRMEVRRPLEG